MSNKRYYWLKLKENFFEEDTINWIEEQENGKDYVLFYLKLCLKSLKTEGILIRNVGDMLVPYDVRKLAEITNTDFDTAVVAMELFKNIGLIEILENGEIFITQLSEMVGSETNKAVLMRRKRALDKQKKQLNSGNNVTDELPKRYTEIEIEKESDIDIDIEKDIKKKESGSTLTKENINLIIKAWNELNLQQLKAINNNTNRYSMLKARINEYSFQEVIQAIESIDKSDFLKGQNDRGWTITFDWFIRPNNFLKVSEGNYIDRKLDNKQTSSKKDIPMKKTRFHNFEQRTDKYSEDDLEEIARKKREEALEKFKWQG